MHLSRFTQTSMTYMMYQYGRKKTNLHQTYSLYHKFFKRNFQISPVHLVRRVHADSANSNVENPNQEKISTKRLLDEAVTFDGDEGTHPDDVWHSDPYEKVRYHKREQGKHFVSPPNIHPKETSILLFPGQGTQFVGMGKDLLEYPNVKEMFEGASQILEYDLLKLCLEGPDRDLEETKYQQPAILVASLAAVERLRHEQPLVLESCVATAGFSIGEITALTFAGAISFENAVRLVKVRGEAMQIASELTRSGMITVLFSPDSKLKFACSVAKEYCVKSGVQEVDCRVASYLYPHCKVVAGNEEALQFIIDNKDDFKLKRIRRLNVSGASSRGNMNSLIFCLFASLALASGKPFYTPLTHGVVPIQYAAPFGFQATPYAVPVAVAPVATQAVSRYHAQADDGSYSFGYSGGPSSRAETRDSFGNVQGAFNYVDPNGVVQSQQYVADNFGFRVAATNLPKAPAVETKPVEETAEVKKARAEFEEAFNKRVKRDADPAFISASAFQVPASTVPIAPPVNQFPTQFVPTFYRSATPFTYNTFVPQPVVYSSFTPNTGFQQGKVSTVAHPSGFSYRVDV